MATISAGKDVEIGVRQPSRSKATGWYMYSIETVARHGGRTSLFNFLVPSHVDHPPPSPIGTLQTQTTTMSLEPLPVFAARDIDELEPIDPELLSLIAADDSEIPHPMDLDTFNKKPIDEFTPLNPTSSPTAVDAFNPGFSRMEVQDLMNLFAPEALKILTMVRSCSEPIKKLGKRSKKCTYAARRREVAFLRQESMVLEKRLNDLQKNRAVSTQTREQAARETYALAKSQAENKRLRALVSSHEARIRQADACMGTANQPSRPL